MDHVLQDAALLALLDSSPRTARERGTAVLRAACPDADPSEWDLMPLGARARRVLDVRARSIGDSIRCVLACVHCGELLELGVEVHRLPAGDGAARVTASTGDTTVTARMVNVLDLVAASTCGSLDAARRTLIERCVVSASRHGRSIAAVDLDDEAVARLAAALEEADPLADLAFEIRCPACGATVAASLDAESFVWTELSRRARELLFEIDAIARRYGWSEQQIVELPASRRRMYLELAS